MNSKDIISALKADGWVQVAQKGSHLQFKHPTKPGRVTVPHPRMRYPDRNVQKHRKASRSEAEI